MAFEGKGSFRGSIPGGGIDLVTSPDYLWTLNTSPQARQLAPRIKVEFYQQTEGRITEALNRWWTNSEAGTLATGGFYENMYTAEKVGTMDFPYFSSKYISLDHDFQDNSAISSLGGGTDLGKAVGDIVSKGAAIASSPFAAGVKFEAPKAWANTTPTDTTFTFNLYNTVGKDTSKYITAHKGLIDLLIFLNSIQKFGPSLMIPPVLCSYNIPGIKYSPVAQMSLGIESVGQLTFKDGITVPDAYNVSITLSDLLIRARNFHDPNGPKSTVKVFTESGLGESIKATGGRLGNIVGGLVGGSGEGVSNATATQAGDGGIPFAP